LSHAKTVSKIKWWHKLHSLCKKTTIGEIKL
jgi:hypothetical protein